MTSTTRRPCRRSSRKTAASSSSPALTRIDEFNEFFNTELSDADYDTVGGLVMHELGRLPRRGEQLDFAGLRFKVLRGDRRRLHTLEVTRLPQPQAE